MKKRYNRNFWFTLTNCFPEVGPMTRASATEALDLDSITNNLLESYFSWIPTNQIFHYTRCIMPKRVMSLRGPSPRQWARTAQLVLKKCRSGGEPLATLCLI